MRLSLLSINNEVQLQARLCQIALEIAQKLDTEGERGTFLVSQDYKALITNKAIKLQFQTQLIAPTEIFYMVNRFVHLGPKIQDRDITVRLPLPDYRIPLMPEPLIPEFESDRKLPYLIIELGLQDD